MTVYIYMYICAYVRDIDFIEINLARYSRRGASRCHLYTIDFSRDNLASLSKMIFCK